MKIKTIILILFLIIGLSAHSQLRHTSGINNFSFTGGVSDFGYLGGIKYGRYLGRSFEIEFNPVIEYNNYKKTSNIGGYFNIMLVYSAINVNEVYYLGPKIGLGANYSVMDFKNTLSNDNGLEKETFGFGPIIGIDNEVFISDHFSFGLDLLYNYNPSAKFGKNRLLSQLSLNIHFY